MPNAHVLTPTLASGARAIPPGIPPRTSMARLARRAQRHRMQALMKLASRLQARSGGAARFGSATHSPPLVGLKRGMAVNPDWSCRMLLTSAINNARPGRRMCLSDFNRRIAPHESILHPARVVDDAGSSLPSVGAVSSSHARAHSSHATKSLEDSPCRRALPKPSCSLS
jgi:hypothetical protein